MNTYIFPYNMGSQGCKDFAASIGAKRIKRTGSKFKGRGFKKVINWGCASLPNEVSKCQVVNQPEAVNKAGNKLLAFRALKETDEINIPDFTDDAEEAQQWIEDGSTVVARTVLRGHSGAGIVLCDNENELVDAPLYVKYIKKQHEYRIHVAFGQVVDQQRKARREDVPDEDVNWKVRNHSNGFIFMREGVDVPEEGLTQARLAVEALGLDFGAVDLIYNSRQDKYYVIEVNTAPGLTGTTLTKYSEVFGGI